MTIPDVVLDKIIENVFEQLQTDTGKKVFTFAVVEKNMDDADSTIELIVVFADGSIMNSFITIEQDGILLGVRIRGKYL
jgi:hypothetical protein